MKCVFCGLIKDIKKDACPSFLVEFQESYAILSDSQKYKGYIILLSKKHEEHLHKIPLKRLNKMFGEVIKSARAINKIFRPARINYANLGNGVPHVHWHIIPRYSNDPNRRHPIWRIPHNKRKGAISTKEIELLRHALVEQV